MQRIYGYLFLIFLGLLITPSIYLKKIPLRLIEKTASFFSRESKLTKDSLDSVILENQILKSQISYIQEWVQSQQKLEEFFSEFKKLEKVENPIMISHEAQKKRMKALLDYIHLFSRHTIAKVIFKEPFSTSSYLWINVGELYNQKIGMKLIQKNSPVVLGDTLLGVVEEVHANFSKIRLITDPKMVVSVRAVRGSSQLKNIQSKTYELLDTLELSEDFTWEKKGELKEMLFSLQQELDKEGIDRHYAIGELVGSEYSPFFAYHSVLVGDGFHIRQENRKLALNTIYPGFKEIAIKKGDLLKTTRLDGIFPAGLKVAIVTETEYSQLGKPLYSIQAKPILENIHELEYVQILPPVLDKPIVD